MNSDRYKVDAAHVVNAYMWDMLEKNLGDYWKTVAPFPTMIVPAQQQPELTESQANYITYVYMDDSTRDAYMLQTQMLEWTIFSPNVTAITSTMALSRDLFGRWDISAAEINEWMKTHTFPAGWEEHYLRFHFQTMYVTGTTSSQPAVDEGGTKDGLVSLQYTFVEND